MRKLECDRCGEVGNRDLGVRKTGKPMGWSWVQIFIKEQPHGEAKKTVYDLCPLCTAEVVAVLAHDS